MSDIPLKTCIITSASINLPFRTCPPGNSNLSHVAHCLKANQMVSSRSHFGLCKTFTHLALALPTDIKKFNQLKPKIMNNSQVNSCNDYIIHIKKWKICTLEICTLFSLQYYYWCGKKYESAQNASFASHMSWLFPIVLLWLTWLPEKITQNFQINCRQRI
jgi:hypothetical protein